MKDIFDDTYYSILTFLFLLASIYLQDFTYYLVALSLEIRHILKSKGSDK